MTEAKRKKFWIDPSAQSRMLCFVLLLLAASLALAYLSMDRGLEQAALRTQRTFIPIDWAREALLGPFYLASAIALITATILTILWSHRFIGPLMVLTAGFRSLRDGDLTGEEHLRDTDSLNALVEDFSKMRATLREKIAEDRQTLEDLEIRLSGLAMEHKSDEELKKELQSIRSELKTVTSFFQLP